MDLSVVVPTYCRPAELARCLRGLAAQTRPPGEVLVVARADDHATWEALRARPAQLSVKTLRVERPGVIESLNAAFDAARGDVMAITDDDAVPRPDWLELLEGHLLANPELGGVGGRDVIHDPEGPRAGAKSTVGTIRWYGRVVGNHHLGAGGPRRVEVLKGVNVAFRREALDGLRVSERLRGRGAQPHWEIYLCLAMLAAGWELLYDPEVVVDHHPAQRFDEDQRLGRPLVALANEVYNETYALLRQLPRRRAAAVLAYGLLVGTRLAPGLVTALEQRGRGKPTLARLGAASGARLEAVRDVVRDARTEPLDP